MTRSESGFIAGAMLVARQFSGERPGLLPNTKDPEHHKLWLGWVHEELGRHGADHKRGKHRGIFLDECPACRAEADR
jgi:hypothetical protein